MELSEAFRWAGLTTAAALAGGNAVCQRPPEGDVSGGVYRSIALLRAMVPTASLVVEVHESAVTQIADVRAMADRLSGYGVQFAYDDFGAGQGRLLELAEVPPHFVKVRHGTDSRPGSCQSEKQQLVAQLVNIVHDVGSTALAEGVETRDEAACCAQMNFDLIRVTGPGARRPATTSGNIIRTMVAPGMAAVSAVLRDRRDRLARLTLGRKRWRPQPIA